MKIEQHLSKNELTDKQFLVIAFETVKYLGWRIRFISDAGVIAYTDNGEHSWNGEITVKLNESGAMVQCVTISNLLNDYGRSEAAVHAFIFSFEKLKSEISEDEVREKYKIYEKDFVPAYEDTLKPDIRPKFHFFGGLLSFFKPAKGYFFTPILIVLNILIYLIMVCSGVAVFEPDAASMTTWGANATIYTLGGQWWRLITSCFIHFGFIHLLLNTYALAFVGLFLEPFLGRVKFITAYLLAGIFASVISLWWHDNTVSAGASGAIFGLYGVFLALLSTNHIESSMRKGLLTNIGLFVVYNLVFGSFKGGIDNAAHLGGLLAGLMIGYAYYPALQKPGEVLLKWLTPILSVTVVMLVSAVIYVNLANSDKVTYQKQIQEFYKIDTDALKVLRGQENNTGEELVRALQHGKSAWSNGIELITELDKMNLSNRLHLRNQTLIKYCRLRIKTCELIAQNPEQGINSYSPQMQQINTRIGKVLDDLK